MSSPIAIPTTKAGIRAAARSLPEDSNGFKYVPVHRRGASASSLPERSLRHLAAPAPSERTPSPSPASHNRYDSLQSVTPEDIPHASKIPPPPRVYTPSALLALASSPAIGLVPSKRARLDSHIPFMLSRTSPARADSKNSANAATPAETQKKAESPRRRRTGRKASGAARARVPPVADMSVDGRRRRAAYGAGWGWCATEAVAGTRAEFGRVPQQGASWRGGVEHSAVAAA